MQVSLAEELRIALNDLLTVEPTRFTTLGTNKLREMRDKHNAILETMEKINALSSDEEQVLQRIDLMHQRITIAHLNAEIAHRIWEKHGQRALST